MTTIIKLSTFLFAALLLFGSVGLALGYLFVPRGDMSRHTIRVPIDRPLVERVHEYVEGTLTPGSGVHSQLSGTWSQFRGDNRDAISTETIPLRRDWTDNNPPPTLWGMRLGEGFAGFAVRNGMVYIKDYDEENQRDALLCLSLDTGELIWRHCYPVRVRRNHGMSRTIPAVTDQYVVSLGPMTHVLCADAITGEKKWLIDLRYVYGTIVPDWYAGQCPLIVVLPGMDTPSAIIAPSGPEVLMVALDCETGEEVWRTPNPFGWNMTHSSIAPMELDGELTFVYLGEFGLVGVRAVDGVVMWSWKPHYWPSAAATCSSPVIMSDNRIFISGGYNRGSAVVQIVANPQTGEYDVQTLHRLPNTTFDTEQQTPIYHEGHIFGLRQIDQQFVCLDLNGRVVWASGRREQFGSGAFIIADGMILIVCGSEGILSGLRASPAGYHKYFEVQINNDYASWAPMSIVQGRLLLRDQFDMKCIDLRQ